MKGLAILGSTGSIGRQTLEILRLFPDQFSVIGLSGWRNLSLLQEQVKEFKPRLVCYDSPHGQRIAAPDMTPASSVTMEEMACHPDVDIVVMAVAGPAGLVPTLNALRAGKAVALASKEVVVMAGQLVANEVDAGATILPVDSEASAIWQCLRGEEQKAARLIITASGGPFRNRSMQGLADVTPDEALSHPTWHMGKKITIDSATLMNKAFEVIEAHWLFRVPWENINVVVHPQSIVHSMVEFPDGSIKAQMAHPDMRLPIQYALFYPQRISSTWLEPLDIAKVGSLRFEPMDKQKYPSFSVAMNAAAAGGTYLAALCGADEVAVDRFLAGKIGFTEIPGLVEKVLSDHVSGDSCSIEDVIAADKWARNRAMELAGA